MGKRLLAWLAILGFIFLILDITFFKYRIDIALFIYSLIIAYFVISRMRSKK